MRTVPSLTKKEIAALVGIDPDEKVRVWTGQHPDVVALAQERGYISADPAFFEEPTWRKGYDWMRAQMAERLPQHSGDYPVWGWTKAPKWKGRNRRVTGFDKDNLVEALVPRSRILLSDYDLWHHPLNNWSIDPDEETHEANWGKLPQEEIESTWGLIFDLQRPPSEWLGRCQVVQACIDRIYLDEIVSVT